MFEPIPAQVKVSLLLQCKHLAVLRSMIVALGNMADAHLYGAMLALEREYTVLVHTIAAYADADKVLRSVRESYNA